MSDGTDALCRAVYGRDARPTDYLGGSKAKMLYDAATQLDAVMVQRDRAIEIAESVLRHTYSVETIHAFLDELAAMKGLAMSDPEAPA